ncbi:DgyrCDS5182 [Dimorphilus gyrociliatus]|uniref:DgyrCDS5182 n=1 Tax=Dimorphilus gyrociliatus TaxID=2664684 RepID=A0A7I8VJ30_9ANNE|nr:DgyrCDS5182 [Dimorphilus gyrociliatus]
MTDFFLSPFANERLIESYRDQQKCLAYLVGYEVSKGETHILGSIKVFEYYLNNLFATWRKNEEVLPANLKFCGVCVTQNQSEDVDEFIEKINKLAIPPDFQSQEQINKMVVLLHNENSKASELPKSFLYNYQTKNYSEIPLEFSKSNILDDCIRFSIKQTINVAYDSKNLKETFASQIDNLMKRMDNPKIVYDILQSDIMLRNNGKTISVEAENSAITILDKIQEESDGFEIVDKKKKNKSRIIKKVPYAVEILESNISQDVSVAVISPIKKSVDTYTLDLNVICFVHRDEKLKNICEIFRNGLKRQISSFYRRAIDSINNNEKLVKYEVVHFWPDQLIYPIFSLYPENSNDEELKKYRESLHDIFLLPKTMPLFRWKNKFDFKHSTKDVKGFLICPHKLIKKTIDPSHNVSLVKGRYTYHHYMQDNFNDSGWGCAYRSLQTLISWFKLQSYTEKDIPSITDIQKTLVKIGDKPENFVNSRQWIGSFEVSFVIEDLLGVSSKFISSVYGSEIASRARELASHFNKIGSPVMIGGNNLAHTILGIDFNEQTGQVKFLILDPHFTGGEDIDIILNKGWCGWKEESFWNQNVTYNMCLPQAPSTV